MAVTLTTAVNNCRIMYGEDDGTSSANSLIPDAFFLACCKQFYRDYVSDIREQAASEATITLVDGTQEYSLESDWKAFKDRPYYEDEDGNRTALRQVDFQERLFYDTDTKGNPDAFYITETNPPKIGLVPVPGSDAADNSLKYRYYKTFTEPSAVAATNFQPPDDFVTPFEWFVLWRAAAKQSEFNRANGYQQEFERALRLARRNWRLRLFGQSQSWHP